MIRRQVENEFWLFAQHDHALLSGRIAHHFGNDRFARPEPFDQTILGISSHDCGWPLHDEQPTLNSAALPLDVFETPPAIGLAVWTASAERAAARDAYCGMLVSLHALALSHFVSTPADGNARTLDARSSFELNKFQHERVEAHDALRNQLGLRTDLPLENGLAPRSTDPDEQNLTFNFRLLQAMDKVSLNICCTNPPFPMIQRVPWRAGQEPTELSIQRPSAEIVMIDPWPFAVTHIDCRVPFRRVERRPFNDLAEFRAACDRAPLDELAVTLRPA
jgi:hypothetical protein